MKLTRVDMVDAGANPGAHIALFKREGDGGVNLSDDNPKVPHEGLSSHEKEPLMPTAEEILKAKETELADITAELQKAHDEIAAKDAEIAQAKAEAPKVEDEIAKAAQVRKELDETRDQLAKLEAEQRKAAFVAKASEFKQIGKADEIAPLLMAADEHFDGDAKKALDRLLKSADAQAKAGGEILFKQLSDGGADEPSGWEARLETSARDRVAKGDFKTVEQAKVAIMHESPEIRKEYRESVGS